MSSIDVDEEIVKHLQWRAMVESLFNHSSAPPVPPKVLIADDKCHLGKWLHSPDSQHLSGNETFQKLKSIHKEFHLSAGAILTMSQQGKHEEAKRFETEFYHQSAEVINYLKALQDLV